MARAKAKKPAIQKGRDQVMESVKNAHGRVLDMAENIIDETLETGAKYQKIATTAIRKSEPIIEKQVDMVFDSMEMFVDQVQKNNKRLQKLFGIEKQVRKTTERINKLVSRVSDRMEESMAGASKVIQENIDCLLYTSPSPRDATLSRMPSSA